MADGVFNIAKGRVVEYYNRVESNDPTNAALIVVVLSAAETDATLEDYDDLGTLLGAAGNTEVTNSGYARKTLTDAELDPLPNPDDTNNRYEVDINDQTWSSVAAGGSWVKLLICYDSDTTGGTDSNIIPLTFHDFSVTPDGSDITAQINTSGFFRAA